VSDSIEDGETDVSPVLAYLDSIQITLVQKTFSENREDYTEV